MHRILLLFFILSSSVVYGQLTGTVFIDDNKNGIMDPQEKGLSDVVVSDGLHVVRTNKKGNFSLKGWEKMRFVTLYPQTDIQSNMRFIPITDASPEYLFPVSKIERKETVKFFHISDTETYETKGWYNNLRAFIKTEKPDFVVHTGDICYRSGLDWHAENAMTEDLGVPTYYCLGNHDLIKGEYGEQYFESKFGPAWYAFESGKALFVITPMMGGDYKPGFTYKEIGTWLKNLLDSYPKEMPKYFFNHDLLSNGDEFIFKADDNLTVNLNDYNLKAWVYGHWHTNTFMNHSGGDIKSYCVSPAAKGGIDHSPSTIRVIEVDESGDSKSYLRWTYVNEQIKIVSPLNGIAAFSSDIPILVNTYDSGSEIDSVRYSIFDDKGFNWNSAINNAWKPMQKVSDWTWKATFKPQSSDTRYQIVVYAYYKDGRVLQDKTYFTFNEVIGSYTPKWVNNAEGNIFMGKPIVADGKVIISTTDNGDARDAAIVAFDEENGDMLWKYKTNNSIKNQIVSVGNMVIGTDIEGITYAVNIKSGKPAWIVDLEYHKLAGFVSGIVADDDIVYTGFGGSLVAIESSSGRILWKNSQWQGGEGSTPTMEVTEDLLIVSSNWRALYAHDKKTGELMWTRSDDGLRFRDGTVKYHNNLLWVAQDSSGVGLLRALDPKTGKTVKSYKTTISNRGTAAPVFDNEKVYIAGSDPGIIALDLNTGEVLWKTIVGESLFYTPQYYSDRQRTIEGTPLLIDDKLFFGALDGYFYILDANNGHIKQKIKLGAPVLSSAIKSEEGFIFTDFAGNVYRMK